LGGGGRGRRLTPSPASGLIPPVAIRRIPLSLLMIAVTTALAVATGALGGGTSGSIVARFGFSLDNLRAGRLYVLPASDWLVYDVTHWSSMLFLFAIFAAPLEAIGGSAFLAETFWPGSWGGTVAGALLVRVLSGPLAWYPHPDLVHQADIGGSVGTWACAGALNIFLNGQPAWLIWPARVASGAYLGYRLAAVHGSADVAHPLGFLIGACLATWRIRSTAAPIACDTDDQSRVLPVGPR
jgi:hypothetical protein